MKESKLGQCCNHNITNLIHAAWPCSSLAHDDLGMSIMTPCRAQTARMKQSSPEYYKGATTILNELHINIQPEPDRLKVGV